jgi:hypothetical protein
MKSCQWIGLICCLLFANTGCSIIGSAVYTATWWMGEPDALLYAKQRAGIGTFPFDEVKPPDPEPTIAAMETSKPPAPPLRIKVLDEDHELVHFSHTNRNLQFADCIAEIEEILKQTSGPVKLEVDVEELDNGDYFSLLRDLGIRDPDGRLEINFFPARSATNP